MSSVKHLVHIRDNPSEMSYCNANPFEVWMAVPRTDFKEATCPKCIKIYQGYQELLTNPQIKINQLIEADMFIGTPAFNIVQQQIEYIERNKHDQYLSAGIGQSALMSLMENARNNAKLHPPKTVKTAKTFDYPQHVDEEQDSKICAECNHSLFYCKCDYMGLHKKVIAPRHNAGPTIIVPKGSGVNIEEILPHRQRATVRVTTPMVQEHKKGWSHYLVMVSLLGGTILLGITLVHKLGLIK